MVRIMPLTPTASPTASGTVTSAVVPALKISTPNVTARATARAIKSFCIHLLYQNCRPLSGVVVLHIPDDPALSSYSPGLRLLQYDN